MRGEIKKLLFIKGTVYFPFKASTENSLQFFVSKVLVLRKNKTTISSTSSYPFFGYSENPCTWWFIQAFKTCRYGVGMGSLRYVIWTVQMMRLQGFKRRCWEVSIVGLADLSSCHLKPHTPIVMNLAYYETEGGWIEQNYLLIQHMGHSMIFPKKITSPHCFLPVSTTVANMRYLRYEIDTRWKMVCRRRRIGTKNAMSVRGYLLATCSTTTVHLDMTFSLSTTYFMNSLEVKKP